MSKLTLAACFSIAPLFLLLCLRSRFQHEFQPRVVPKLAFASRRTKTIICYVTRLHSKSLILTICSDLVLLCSVF